MPRRLDDGNPMVTAGLIATSAYVVLGLLVQAAAHIVQTWSCPAPAPWTPSPVALPGLILGRMSWILPGQGACTVGTGQIWLLVGPVLAAAALVVLAGYRRRGIAGGNPAHGCAGTFSPETASPAGRRSSANSEPAPPSSEAATPGPALPNPRSRKCPGPSAAPAASPSTSPPRNRSSSRARPAPAKASTSSSTPSSTHPAPSSPPPPARTTSS